MMEENKFFCIKSEAQDGSGLTSFTIHLCEGHKVYEGHFPGKPVCPGVMTVAMVRECACKLAGRALEWVEIKNCRLTGMLFPGCDIVLALSLNPAEDRLVIAAEISDEADAEKKYLSLSGSLR